MSKKKGVFSIKKTHLDLNITTFYNEKPTKSNSWLQIHYDSILNLDSFKGQVIHPTVSSANINQFDLCVRP